MEYLAYKNTDETTQIFIGAVLIAAILYVIVANLYYCIRDYIRDRK